MPSVFNVFGKTEAAAEGTVSALNPQIVLFFYLLLKLPLAANGEHVEASLQDLADARQPAAA
jgi:hypothetical protein